MKVNKFYIAPSKVISEVFFVKVLGNFSKAELIEKRRTLWNMEGLYHLEKQKRLMIFFVRMKRLGYALGEDYSLYSSTISVFLQSRCPHRSFIKPRF